MTETNFMYSFGNYSIIFVQEREQQPNLACAALLLLLVLTLILNSFVFLSVAFSTLRTDSYNVSVAVLSGVSLLDGIFNVTSSIVFNASWKELPHIYGEDTARKWCSANATLLQINGTIQSLVYAVMLYDRLSALPLRNEEMADSIRRKSRAQTMLKSVIILSIFMSVITSLPITLGLFTTSLFEQRMTCSTSYVSEQPVNALLAVIIMIIYVSSWIFTIRTTYVIVRKVVNERKRLIELDYLARLRDPSRGVTYSGVQLWRRICGSSDEHPVFVLTGLLALSFLTSVVPNIISGQISQFFSYYNHSKDSYFPARNFSSVDVIRTDVFDTIFSWTRYGYNVLSPSLILLIHPGIRTQFKATFCFWWHGKVDLPKLNPVASAFVKRGRTKEIAHHATPVLFSTSEGLHLRTVKNGGRSEEPHFLLSFCDLIVEEPSVKPRNSDVLSKSASPATPSDVLDKTFVVKKLGETYVKYPNNFDISGPSGLQNNTIEMKLISESF